MKRIFGRWIAPIALSAIVLAGCGSESISSDSTATVSSLSVANADADIASGCWTAADRGAGEGIDAKGVYQQWKKPPAMVIDTAKTYSAAIETSAGTIQVELYPKDAPIAVNSFVCLAKAGYFDDTRLHRIVKDFVIQGGDPTATGTGGPGYRFDDEPIEKEYEKGTLAMANSGPDTNGSQFFICTADLSQRLPKAYTIFGQVTSGMDVVDVLNNTPTTDPGTGEKSTPIEPVKLVKMTITES